MLVRLSLEYRLESLDFNNLADEMLLEKECQNTKKGIRCTGKSINHLDATTKFVSWFEQNELGGDDFDEVDDTIENPIYVPAI